MNQLEIATQIFCSGKANTIDEAWILAGEFIALDKPISIDLTALENRIDKQLNEDFPDKEALEHRTATRTQELFDLGFEWNEDRYLFVKDSQVVKESHIEEYSHDEWESLINVINNPITDPTPTVEEAIQHINESFPSESNEPVTEDLFKGKDYIEFEMDKSICRLYKLSNQTIAEEDLQVTKKLESGFIITSSDNEEHQLGITIYKK